MRLCRWIAGVAFLFCTSCSQNLTPDSRKEAQERWSEVRARVKCQLATEAYNAGRLDESWTHLAESIALGPQNGEPYILRAKILLERGETGAASESLEEAMQRGGDTPETDYLSGVIAQRYGDFDTALGWYQRAAKREPQNAHYVAAVAETLVALGRNAEALQLVRSRWTDFEQNATLRSLAGGIHMMLNQYKEAADAYRDAARVAPDDVLVQYSLGTALSLAGAHGEAVTVLEAVAQDQSEVPASVLLALGRSQLARGRHEQARRSLLRATDAEPGNAAAWALLARCGIAGNDLLLARRAASRASQLTPESAETTLLFGYVCLLQRDPAAAVPLLEELVTRSPDDPVARRLLERCRGTAVSVAGGGRGKTASP